MSPPLEDPEMAARQATPGSRVSVTTDEVEPTEAQTAAANEKADKLAKPVTGKKVVGSRVLTVGSNASSSNGEHRFAREISETFSMKLREMKWCLLALISNVLMIVLVEAMVRGVEIDMNKETVQTIEGIVLEILLLVSNIFTVLAMDTGLSAFFGFQMATRGRSMAVIGFSQSSSVFKWSFANDLSLNSSVRKILNRLAVIWAITEFLKLITPIGASALHSDIVHKDADHVNCVLFNQVGKPVDRKWPNFEAQLGFAEMLFGKSIGLMRSEEDLEFTTAVIGPQLNAQITPGDEVVGEGFTLDIHTTCLCSSDDSADALIEVGTPHDQADTFHDMIRASDRRNWYLINHLALNHTEEMFHITTAVLNTQLCGGFQISAVPICKTKISNHRHAVIMMEYMTDGVSNSIAQKAAHIRENLGEADLNIWAYAAFQNMLGEGVQKIVVPTQVPGSLSTLLRWTSTDLMSIDPVLIEAGLETCFAVLFRAGIQRTYNTEGGVCTRNIIDDTKTILYMKDYGVSSALAALIIQVCIRRERFPCHRVS